MDWSSFSNSMTICCKFKLSNQHYVWYKWGAAIQKYSCTVLKYVMLVVGPIMLVFANILILSVAVMFIIFYMPQIAGESTIAYAFHLTFGSFLMLNIFANYYLCAFTPPGSPSFCPDPGKVLGEKVSIVDGRKIYQLAYKLNVGPNIFYKYCQTCKAIKPPRAHHDSVTGKCVFHMDHYCPWMSNCVGFYNYRYFVLFLSYMVVGCTYVIIFTLFRFNNLSLVDRTYIRMNAMLQTNLFEAISVATYCFSLALSALISVGLLLIWHTYLCFTNQTTIEFYLNLEGRQEAYANGTTFRNPYDEGWRKNLRRIFGEYPWYYYLIPRTCNPPDPKYPFDLDNHEIEKYPV